MSVCNCLCVCLCEYALKSGCSSVFVSCVSVFVRAIHPHMCFPPCRRCFMGRQAIFISERRVGYGHLKLNSFGINSIHYPMFISIIREASQILCLFFR